tara:strand:- start:1084 stop:1902 length:819 start_codon:yes stop_codon:yes gene_type:complete
MAKKQTKVVQQPQIEDIKIEEAPVKKQKAATIDTWEVKDRNYYLTRDLTPLTYTIKSTDIYWFDDEKGYERELKHTSNQRTCFVDEMKGDQRLEHITFRNGALYVPKNKQPLQKLLSLYHPNLDSLYLEDKPVEQAADEIDWLEMEIEALMAAKNMDIDMAEAIMRVELGSNVAKMSSKELKRDLLLYAKSNPELFLDLVNDDNVILRNFGIKATEMGILKISSDNRTFLWGSNDRKLMNVPFDEHPYSALAAWFKTDEGMDIYKNIEKQLM